MGHAQRRKQKAKSFLEGSKLGDFDGRATSPDYRGQRYGDWRERERREIGRLRVLTRHLFMMMN